MRRRQRTARARSSSAPQRPTIARQRFKRLLPATPQLRTTVATQPWPPCGLMQNKEARENARPFRMAPKCEL